MNLITLMGLLERETSKDKLIQLIEQHRNRYDTILEFVQRKFNDDADVVRAGTVVDVRNIRFASDRLRNDEEFATELVQREWSILRYLGYEARKNRNVVLTAIRQNGMAIQYAVDELWDDAEIVEEAIQQNPDVIDWLDSLKNE
jgi:hypothetical protein